LSHEASVARFEVYIDLRRLSGLYRIRQRFHGGGAGVKKIPIIGLLIGAVAAIFALRKKKGDAPTEDTASADRGE
jgi:hypothetical protein